MFANVPCALLDRYIRTSANIAGRGRNEGWFGYRFGYGFALLAARLRAARLRAVTSLCRSVAVCKRAEAIDRLDPYA